MSRQVRHVVRINSPPRMALIRANGSDCRPIPTNHHSGHVRLPYRVLDACYDEDAQVRCASFDVVCCCCMVESGPLCCGCCVMVVKEWREVEKMEGHHRDDNPVLLPAAIRKKKMHKQYIKRNWEKNFFIFVISVNISWIFLSKMGCQILHLKLCHIFEYRYSEYIN